MKKITQFIKRIRGRFESTLPIGMAEFEDFCLKIFDVYGIPDNPSYRHAIATMVLHLGPTVHRKPMNFFARSIRKAQANQCAWEWTQIIKQKEKEDAERPKEVTRLKEVTTQGEASDESLPEQGIQGTSGGMV